MEEVCRVLVIGDSLFTETLTQMLVGAADVQVVGTASSRTEAITAVAETLPHVIIVADVAPPTEDTSGSLLSLYPDIPIIYADLNQDYVQIITSRRISARREDLLAAIQGLFETVDRE